MLIISIILSVITLENSEGSTYVPLDDEVYSYLQKFEAEGLIESGLLTTKPLSYREVLRLIIEAEKNSYQSTPFIRNKIQELKERFVDETKQVSFFKPMEKLYAVYRYQDKDSDILNYNLEGDTFTKENNLRSGFETRFEVGRFSFSASPEFRYSQNANFYWKKLYGILHIGKFDFEFGKDSQWWGPGYHGSILLSNNAKPFTMLKISNPEPIILPWIFRYLGLFKLTAFVTKLEKDRLDVAEPYLWGIRFNFKPRPYIEIGLERTALLGGKGRSNSFSTWWKSFTNAGEHISDKETGDQRAGGDIKITVPWKIQPFQVYFEAAGEDSAGNFPTKWAYLGGIYLPRILSFEPISIRVEYATTHVPNRPNVWYNHHIYTAGYTYYGRIIGHHMGTDSKDLYVEIEYLFQKMPMSVNVYLDKEKHSLSNQIKPEVKEYGLKINLNLTKDIKMNLSFTQLETTKNFGDNLKVFTTELIYKF